MSEGGRFKTIRIRGRVERPPSLTLLVSGGVDDSGFANVSASPGTFGFHVREKLVAIMTTLAIPELLERTEAEAEVTGGLSPRVVPMGEIRDLGSLTLQ